MDVSSCPCGAGKQFKQCCGQYIDGALAAPDALALMRSRYTAYAQGNEAYLQKTWHPTSRPAQILQDQTSCKWISLKIISHHQEEHTATVEFIAIYKINGRAEKLHEISRFVFEGEWLYVDGQHSG